MTIGSLIGGTWEIAPFVVSFLAMAVHEPGQNRCNAAGMDGATVEDMANRLASATSPYLLQHKDNPVDW